MLMAALKYVQYSAALSTPAGSPGHLVTSHMNSMLLLCASSTAAYQALGWETQAEIGAAQRSVEQQLMWFQVLGRLLVAAGQLLQQIPQFVSAEGSWASADIAMGSQQLPRYGKIIAMPRMIVTTMQSMLQQGGAAAAAVDAGLPTAAATPEKLTRLLRQAADLQQQLAPIISAFFPPSQAVQGGGVQAAMQQLRAACQAGGLPQQLQSFGVACCAAFPQHGCCGNPGCNLEKFTETALASRGCSGCDKVRNLQIHPMSPALTVTLYCFGCRVRTVDVTVTATWCSHSVSTVLQCAH